MGSSFVDADIQFSAFGDVKYTSVESGSQSWKTGSLQVGILKTGKSICIVNFKIGHHKTFNLTNNIKSISKNSSNPGRFTIALRSGPNISLNKGNPQEVHKLNEVLEEIKNSTKSSKKSLNSTKAFDLLQSPTNARTNGYHTPLHTSQNNGIRRTPFINGSSKKLALGSSPNGSHRSSRTQHVASRRSTIGFDHEDNDGAFNTSSDEGEVKVVPQLFVDERGDHAMDKENRTTERSVYHQRKKENTSLFLPTAAEKIDFMEEKRTKSMTPGLAKTNKNFYGTAAASRGQKMLFASKNLGGGASFASNRSSVNTVKTKPGMLSVTPNSHKKSLRTLDAYDGWGRKTYSKPTNINFHGFSNLGNTCYMNAILQSLFGLESFTEDLLKSEVMKTVEKVSLYWAVTSLLQAKQQRYSADQIGSKLRLVKTAISATATRFSGFMQHDAHEFLCQCLDQLKEDVDNATKNKDDNGDDDDMVSENTTTSQLHLPCPITQNFEFKVLHTIRCKECGEEVTKTEEFYDLSVDMPRISAKSGFSPNIQTALDQFFRKEEIEYSCNECDCKMASVFHEFTKIPRIIILHLKRYTFDVEASVNAKLRQPIIIPKYLTLAWHCSQDTEAPQKRTHNANGFISTTPSNGLFHSSDGNHDRVSNSNHGGIRKRLSLDFSPKDEAKPPSYQFKRKRVHSVDSDTELEKDPFSSDVNTGETQRAIAESKAEEEKRRLEEDEMQKVLEESKHDVSPVKELASMTEEEQIQYALALSRGECIELPSDTNGNQRLTHSDENGHTGWLNDTGGKELVPWNGFHQTISNGTSHTNQQGGYAQMGEDLDLEQPKQQGEFAEIGRDHEQRLPENSRTGEGSPATDVSRTYVNGYQPQFVGGRTVEPEGVEWVNRSTILNGDDAPGHAHMNGDSGFDSPDMNGQQDNTDMITGDKDIKLSADKDPANETRDDSAIEIDLNKENLTPPTIPPKKSKLDYSNVIDLCNNDGTEHSGGGEDSAGNTTTELSYAEMKAKEDDEISKAMELSLQDFRQVNGETEEEQLRRAQEMSLEEFNKSSVSEVMDWSPVEETPNDKPMYNEEQLQEINANIENGDMPHSYRLVSVVNHIGSSSSAGHYVSDVYDAKKDAWFSYDDSEVQKIDEATVREQRRRSGYIFFYALNYH